MSDVLKFGKKVFTVSVVGTTMLWSVGVSALLPAVAIAAVCPTLAAGDMIKVGSKPAIYSVNKDGKVLYFPSGDEFKSWSGLSATAANQYAGYVSVTQDCFDSLAVPSAYPGAVNYRAGSYVVKRPSSDQLYVVLPGNSLAKVSVTDAKALYGTNYKVMTVADAFWPHYVNRGADVAGTVHEGMLVSNAGKTWYVAAGGALREVTAAGMTANRLKSGFVHAVAAAALAGTSVGTALDAAESALANRTQDGTLATPGPGPAPVVGGNLTVSLAADNPAAANLADGSAYNSVLKLTLGASSATQVTGITLTKTGLIANSNISGVSVWDAQGNRHGDVMTSLTSDNKVTVSFGTNPIMVAAGGSESLTVKVNISASANSGLVGFSVNAATDVASNGTVGGSFPVAGNQMSIIDGNASLAGVSTTLQSVGGGTIATPVAALSTGNLNVGDKDKEVAKLRVTETSGNEDVSVSRLTFYFEGTVQDADLANFSVYAPDGTKLGSAAAMVSRYVTVNLTPYTVPKSTNRDLVLKVDVMNGSGRYFIAHLQNDYDILVKGVSTGFFVLPGGFTDTRGATSEFQMTAGILTLNKNIASPSGNISAGAQSIVLAKFDVKAVGENMELRKMGLGVATSIGGNPKNLTGNVVVRDAADGTVYLTVAASTASLYTTGAQNNLSNYIQLTANQTRTLEVVGSVDSTATSGNKYTVGVGDFYAKRASSLDFVDNLPTSGITSTAANQLTVNATSLTCYKDTAMGSVTRAPGATTVIGQYICTAGTSEDVRLSNLTVAFGNTAGTSGNAASMFQNMSLWNGATQLGSSLSTVATSSNSWSFDLTVAKSQTVTLQVKALIVSGAAGTVSSSVNTYSFNGKDSGTAGTGATVNGQTVTVGAGNLVVTAVSDATTISSVYGPGRTGVQLGKWKVAAANDDVTLSKLTLTTRYSGSAADATTLGTFSSLSLYDGTTLLASGNYVAGDVVFTGFSSTVSMDSYKVLTLKGNTNSSGVITNNTSTAFVIKDDSNTSIEARSAAGALLGTADISATSSGNVGPAETRFATSTAYIYHDAYPTVVAGSVGTAIDVATNAKIFKFTVTNSGTRDLRFGSTTIAVSVSGLQATDMSSSGTIKDFRLYEEGATAGTLGTYLAGSSASTADVTVGTTTQVSATNITFDPTNDQNSLLDSFLVSPGASRTLIMTANTNNMCVAKTVNTSVNLSAKISGSTGWSGTIWNTGNLFYYSTPVGGTENVVPYSASDSYDVSGASMSKGC